MSIHSVKTQLALTFSIVLVILAGMGLYIGNSYFNALEKSSALRDLTSRTVMLSRDAQLHFKKQVQEWKDILLRGHKQSDFEKYFHQFLIEERRVGDTLEQLLPLLNEIPEAKNLAEKFVSAHAELRERYRTALTLFNAGHDNPYDVDAEVRGIDRKPTDLLDQVVEKIAAFQEQQLRQQDQGLMEKVYRLLATGILILTFSLFLLYRYLNHFVIQPFFRATHIAEHIADGDFNATIDISGPDEIRQLFMALDNMQTSLAASEKSLKQEIEERRQAQEQIERHTYFDALTNLPNRRMLQNRLSTCLVRGRRKQACALFILDLDHFKTINSSLGHAVGDTLLQEVAQRLLMQMKPQDTVARLGGDEFAILLVSLESQTVLPAELAMEIADKILTSISKTYFIDNEELHTTCSIGISLFSSESETVSDVMKQADTALHRSKAAGRNTISFFSPMMQIEADEHLKLQNDLRYALVHKEFSLHYQPQLDKEGRINGAEALLRWNHHQRGPVSPGQFIPVAEASDLILPIGDWVLREACGFIKYLASQNLMSSMAYIAVNISPKQFHQADFVDQLQHILKETGIAPDLLELELTEGVVIENIEDTVSKMKAIKDLGVQFSIDDFGTGYSSLSYLKQLPLDTLKIDQSFVRDVADNINDAAIVIAILSMSKHLGFRTIAEGVETREQLDFLCENGCQIYQGYYFSKPLPKDDFIRFLNA